MIEAYGTLPKYTHINGIENAMTWSQKRADEYWAKRN